MPGIAVAGTKIQGLGVNGDNAQGIASGGNVIFRSYVPVGTVLWSGGKYFKSDTNITLAKPISQLKTGIVINVTKFYYEEWEVRPGSDDPNNPPKHYGNGDLLNKGGQQFAIKGKPIGTQNSITVTMDSFGPYKVPFKIINDNTIAFGDESYYDPGTQFINEDSWYPRDGQNCWLTIDSITAY